MSKYESVDIVVHENEYMRIGPFGLGTGLILLGLAVDKKNLMKATSLEAHEGEFMAEVGRRDSRKKSINSLIRKSEGLKKILKKAEFADVKQKLSQLESKFDEIENKMSDPLSDC